MCNSVSFTNVKGLIDMNQSDIEYVFKSQIPVVRNV